MLAGFACEVGGIRFYNTEPQSSFFRCEFSEFSEWLIGTGDTEDVETERNKGYM